MRRKEFEVEDQAVIAEWLEKIPAGVLTVADPDEVFYSFPLNFAFRDGVFHFHGAFEGRKSVLLKNGVKAQFTVFEPYSFIPSYFSGKDYPCFATQFFISVMAFGKIAMVESQNAVLASLGLIMEKYQPEGGFSSMAEVPKHSALVFSLKADEISAKFKFGQQLPPDAALNLMRHLQERATPLDQKTLECMKRYRNKS